MKPPCILFLLDWLPTFWSTREEYFVRLSRCLVTQGLAPVITVPEPVSDQVRGRFEEAGAHLRVCPYRKGYGDRKSVV